MVPLMIAGERERERERERESIVVPLMIAAGPNKAVREDWTVSLLCLWAQGRAESGGIVFATAYWAMSAQGGVTRRGVVLTYLLSLVIGSQ